MKIGILTALLLTGFASPTWAQDSEIQKRTQAFLDAYARGDRHVILKLIDKENIMMYGSEWPRLSMGRTH